MQGTPLGNFGITEGVQGADGALDDFGGTDEYHFEAFWDAGEEFIRLYLGRSPGGAE